MKRETVFVVQVAWLVVLGVLAGLYFQYRDVFVDQPLGLIPIGVVWFGALGAVVISINGVIEHAHDWDPSYYLWHLSRPLMGAALAVVAVLMLQAGILAVGGPSTAGVNPTGAVAASGAPSYLLFYLVAFLVGYREETFRDLIKRLVDLIIAPASAKPAPTIAEVQPSSAQVTGHVPVVITGAGLSSATSVMFGSRPAEFHVDSDARVTAQLPSTDTPGGVTLVVKTSAGAASTTFQYAA